MKLLTIDFETYYAKDFSLTKITTEEYIRDDRFETIGVSVQVDDGEPEWFSGTKAQTKQWLDKFPWDESIAIAHNANFDMAILNWHYDIRPKRIADTLSMARPIHGTQVGGSLAKLSAHYGLGEKGTEIINALGFRRLDFTKEGLHKYGEYCRNDVALTFKLFSILALQVPVSELKLIDLTVRMFTEPTLELDYKVLNNALMEEKDRKAAVLEDLADTYGWTPDEVKKKLMSNNQFAQLLKSNNVIPPTKISKTTGKEAYAFAKTDEGMKALLDHENRYVRDIASARLGTKSTIEETRLERFLGIAERGKMPVPLKYYAAHTGRWGGMDKVNMQNLPRTSQIKYALCAPEGHLLIDADSSQIEARMLAWLAGQDDLVEAFEKGEDVYKIMASKIYGKSVDSINGPERFIGKMSVLGCGYGMGHVRFGEQLKAMAGVDLPEHELQHIVNTYRESYPQITDLWRRANDILRAIANNQYTEFGRNGILKVEGEQGIRLPNGFHIRYPNLRREVIDEGASPQWVYDEYRSRKTATMNKIYGGKIVENVTQALARIVIGEQIIKISAKYRPVMTVHDAVAIVVPEDDADTGKEWIELCMRLRPEWAPELPLDCESGMGKSYGECK